MSEWDVEPCVDSEVSGWLVWMCQPIYLRKHRLNIEEKKPKEELVAARQSVPRGGRRGGFGRGGIIADEART